MKTKRTVSIIFIVAIIIKIIVIAGIVLLCYNLFTNPESVGEFFGRITKGFNNTN